MKIELMTFYDMKQTSLLILNIVFLLLKNAPKFNAPHLFPKLH